MKSNSTPHSPEHADLSDLIAVCAEDRDQRLTRAATLLADELGLEQVEAADRSHAMLLALTCDRIELRSFTDKRNKPMFVNLLKVDGTSGIGRSRRQPIARAVGLSDRTVEPPHVIDATAGFGEDAWLLAALGCRVTAVERHPVVVALLADGLRRAATIMPEIAGRVRVMHADARELLSSREHRPVPDVVYIDTMFPQKRKAARDNSRKPMRLLRQLVGTDDDAKDLLDAARRVALRRVVVKRPVHGPTLSEERVSQHRGKSARYDVYNAAPPESQKAPGVR